MSHHHTMTLITLMPSLKRWALVFVLCPLVGCATMSTRVEYRWGSYSTRDQNLYVIRRVASLQGDALPVPERSAPHVVSERFDVLVADLTGTSGLQPVKFRMLPPEASAPADYEYVGFDREGHAELWERNALAARLRSAGNISCSGSVQYDEQDARVLYYRCDHEGMAYRFEPPYQQACAVRLGAAGGMEHPLSSDYRFWSTAGQPVAFISVGWGFLYRIDLCRDQAAKALDRFAEPDQAMSDAPANPPKWSEVQQLRHRLIGIAEGMRLYQVAGSSGDAVLMMSADGAARRYPLPAGLSKAGGGRYLAQGGFVVWNVMDAVAHRHIIHSLDLNSGRFSRTEIPF